MSTAVIQSLLDAAVTGIENIPQLMLENEVLNATSNLASFARSTLLPAQSAAITVGTEAQRKMQGFYQVDVFYPSGSGSNAAHVMADAVVNAFPIGLVLTDGTVKVFIEMASVLPAYLDNKYYSVPVQVQWSCYVS